MLAPDGKILVAGGVYHGAPFTSFQTITQPVVRLNSDGSLDTSFNSHTTLGLLPEEPYSEQRVAVHDMVQQANPAVDSTAPENLQALNNAKQR